LTDLWNFKFFWTCVISKTRR